MCNNSGGNGEIFVSDLGPFLFQYQLVFKNNNSI